MIEVFCGRDCSGLDHCGIYGNRDMLASLIDTQEMEWAGVSPIWNVDVKTQEEPRMTTKFPILTITYQMLPLTDIGNTRGLAFLIFVWAKEEVISFSYFTVKKWRHPEFGWFSQVKEKAAAGPTKN